jgi:hypothetical protein
MIPDDLIPENLGGNVPTSTDFGNPVLQENDFVSRNNGILKVTGLSSTLTRLQKWKSGHKARSVKISIDDGYGATCWVVELWGKGKKFEDKKEGYVFAAEVNFFEYDKLPEYVVYIVDGNSDEDWPGLEAVINAALDKAEKLGL